jgi:hypothetical protein
VLCSALSGLWRCTRADTGAGTTAPSAPRAAQSREAVERLEAISQAMQAYVTDGAPSCALLRVQFPQSVGRTPAEVPRGTLVRDPPGTWDAETWRALSFAFSTPHAYSYEVISGERWFTARAYGDLDGDGVLSTFERTGTLSERCEFERGPGLRVVDGAE